MTATPKVRKVRVTVEIDAEAWAKLAKLAPADVPADVADYLGELVRGARSSYAGLILDVRKS